jgi:hypothetical protein
MCRSVLRTTVPSSRCSFFSDGNTDDSSCRMIEALMYGTMPAGQQLPVGGSATVPLLLSSSITCACQGEANIETELGARWRPSKSKLQVDCSVCNGEPSDVRKTSHAHDPDIASPSVSRPHPVRRGRSGRWSRRTAGRWCPAGRRRRRACSPQSGPRRRLARGCRSPPA